MPEQNSSQPILFIGIDWADQAHVACLLDDNANTQVIESFQQDPDEIANWVASLQKRFPQHRLLIALEQSCGALMAGLAGFPQLELFPINPKLLANDRKVLYPSCGKNDPDDALLLAKLLKEHQQKLRPWKPDSVETRQIAEMTELRRKLVEELNRVVLRLNSSLKGYFPLILQLSKRELHYELIIDLLRRWPTLKKLKRVHPDTLRKFLSEHGMKNDTQQTEFINTIRSATPLTKDDALIEPRAMYVKSLAQQIRDLNKAIAEFDDELHTLTAQHPDQELFRSLPGAGDALVPRLIAAFGSDREKYTSAKQVQNYSGIAPITQQSGKSKQVYKRLACPKFLRQTFHRSNRSPVSSSTLRRPCEKMVQLVQSVLQDETRSRNETPCCGQGLSL